MTDRLDQRLREHLLRSEGEEDLAFALYTVSNGSDRVTALLHTVILPDAGDRQVHGNASFNLTYFERVLDRASREGSGIAFLHSHLGPGWQSMSEDDVIAENRLAGPALTITDLPLVGLTVGTDGTWSARFWVHETSRKYVRRWCETVRVVGEKLSVSFDNRQLSPPVYREMFRRTRTVWGDDRHAAIARLHVGIVGLGSVGMAIAETAARSGLQRVTLIDFDEVKPHNLDRLQGATEADVHQLKVRIAKRLIERSATAEAVRIAAAPFSVIEPEGYQAALNCDIIFSCVDRPRARQLLNVIAYAHLIPVIDGGIAVRFRDGEFLGAEWQTQTVAPGKPCLECLNAFSSGDADTERAGKLDDPSYMKGLPPEHHLKRNENIYAFSTNLASLEFFQFLAYVGQIAHLGTPGVQRFHLVAGMLDTDTSRACGPACDIGTLVARGDTPFGLTGRDHAAEVTRGRRQGSKRFAVPTGGPSTPNQ